MCIVHITLNRQITKPYLEYETCWTCTGITSDVVSTVAVTVTIVCVRAGTFIDIIASQVIAVQCVPITTEACVGSDVVGTSLSAVAAVSSARRRYRIMRFCESILDIL